MLKEINNPRQVQGEPQRRWFGDADSDLIVWIDDAGVISGFQLCYDKGKKERALTWRRATGFTHEQVDDGEGRRMQHKSSPVLAPNGHFDIAALFDDFRDRSIEIDPEITAFVLGMLAGYREKEAGAGQQSDAP